MLKTKVSLKMLWCVQWGTLIFRGNLFLVFQAILLQAFAFWYVILLTVCITESFDFVLLVLGYLEDRRPASNMDPYIVTSLLAETTLLWEPTLEAEALAAQKLALNVWNQSVEDKPLGLKTQSIGTKQPSVWSIFPHLLNLFEKDPL